MRVHFEESTALIDRFLENNAGGLGWIDLSPSHWKALISQTEANMQLLATKANERAAARQRRAAYHGRFLGSGREWSTRSIFHVIGKDDLEHLPLMISDLWTGDGKVVDELVDQMDQALAIMGNFAPKTYSRVLRNVSWIVPINYLGAPFFTNFTHEHALKAVNLTPQQNAYSMAETLVHEGLHSELYGLEFIAPIVGPNSLHKTAFSPWRNAVRPLRMVAHGIYVFAGVWEFYEELLSTNTNDCFVTKRHQWVKSATSNAARGVDTRDLTDIGRTIFDLEYARPI